MNFDLYTKIANRESIKTRLDRGTCATLVQAGDDWLVKEDAPGEQGVAWEYQVYSHIGDKGLLGDIVPEVALEEGDETLFIKKINNAATLADYVAGYQEGLLPLDVLKCLFKQVGEVVARFHESGYVHGDLHSRNIVIGMDRKCAHFRAYLIDLASAYHAELEEEFCEYWMYIQEELYTPEDDLRYLEEHILEICSDHEIEGLLTYLSL